jgi:hypothetical protein
MRTGLSAFLTGLGLLLGSVTSAQAAADYCIIVGNLTTTLALKSFSLPGKGRCVEARGFYKGAPASPLFANGSACTASDGSQAVFVLTASADDFHQIQRLTLDLPAALGSGRICTLDTGAGGACETVAIGRVTCFPAVVPVP